MRFHGIDLNLLVVIDALLSEGNVSRAALRLNLTQPAVSNALARLRAHFQDELFVPVGRRMAPTELAQRLAGPIRQVLEQSQQVIEERAGFDPATAKRRFYLAVSDYEGSVFVPELARELAAVAPGVTLSLHLTVSYAQRTFPQVSEILEQRNNDFVILPEQLASPNYPLEKLYEEHYLCIAWAGNDQIGEHLSLEQYLDAEHVITEFGDGRSPSFDAEEISRLGYERRIGTSVEQFSLMAEFVIGTRQIATMHAGLARRLAQRLPLKVLPVPLPLPTLSVVVQWKRAREGAGVRWFLDMLRRVARESRERWTGPAR